MKKTNSSSIIRFDKDPSIQQRSTTMTFNKDVEQPEDQLDKRPLD